MYVYLYMYELICQRCQAYENIMIGRKALFMCLILLTFGVTVSKKIVETNRSSIVATILKVVAGPVVILPYFC